MESNAQIVHDKSIELLEKAGMKFLHREAQDLLRAHGIRMDADTAFFTEEQLMHYVDMAPTRAHIYARDPRFDVRLGDGDVSYGPAMGPVKIVSLDGAMRPSTVDDLVKAVKLVEGNDRFHINGGGICIPTDVPVDQAMLFQLYLGLLLSSKVPPDVSGDYRLMNACFDLLAAAFGGDKEELVREPRILAGINVDSPLFLDRIMTETLFTCLKYRQPCYIAPASIAGMNSPVTVGGTIVQNNAEVLATIALSQMYAPGAPVLYGVASSGVSFRTLSAAIGSPEAALLYRYACIMAEFYGLPCRTGGVLTDAKRLDVQAGYESMLTYLSCAENGVDVVLHACGLMDSAIGFSFEKMVVDFQIMDIADIYRSDVTFDELSVPLETMEKVGPGGSFVMEEHTFENYREAILDPQISVCGRSAPNALYDNIGNTIDDLLTHYRSPNISQDCMDAMRSIVSAQGMSDELIAKAENAR